MHKITVILGTMFGDEGKGKIVDYLSADFDYVVRFQGGDNAGHTITHDHQKHILRLIPAGIFQTKAIIAQGVVVNPHTLLMEIDYLSQFLNIDDKLFISNKVHIIFDFHIQMDKLMEQVRDKDKIGSTHKGIGPCYGDKSNRLGIRLHDLFDYETLLKKLQTNLSLKNPIFKQYDFPIFDAEELAERYFHLGQQIKKYAIDSFVFFREELQKDKRMLFEGSQGILLDIDHGTYPFVTSSNIVSAISSGTSLPPSIFQCVVGVVKAYSTRVGNGIFVTEIQDKALVENIRKRGNEFGSVTKRPRRIGWLDLMSIKYSVLLSGINEIILTLVDVLSTVGDIWVCVGYLDENGKELPVRPPSFDIVRPNFKIFKGWNDDFSSIDSFEQLSDEFKAYVFFLEEFLSLKISHISTGKNRQDIVVRR